MKPKQKTKQQIGKRARINGAKFERDVRADLELKGWFVSKFQNNVSDVYEQDIGEYVRDLIPAKASRYRLSSTGFPDFICHRKKVIPTSEFNNIQLVKEYVDEMNLYEIIGVEAKTRGYLKPEEKQKCIWLLNNKVFSKILIASKKKVGRKTIIIYKEFKP